MLHPGRGEFQNEQSPRLVGAAILRPPSSSWGSNVQLGFGSFSASAHKARGLSQILRLSSPSPLPHNAYLCRVFLVMKFPGKKILGRVKGVVNRRDGQGQGQPGNAPSGECVRLRVFEAIPTQRRQGHTPETVPENNQGGDKKNSRGTRPLPMAPSRMLTTISEAKRTGSSWEGWRYRQRGIRGFPTVEGCPWSSRSSLCQYPGWFRRTPQRFP